MSIYRRKSGRYAVLVDVDRGVDGKRKRRALGTFATRKDAERAEREALTARDRGVDIAPDRVTVGQLLDRYLKDRSALGRGAKTVERYESLVKHNLVPHIGSVPLSKLRPAHVSELVATLGKCGGFGGRALSAKSVKHAYALLKGALAWAVRQELVGRNVAEAVSPPTVGRGVVAAISVDEAKQLFAAADKGRWGPFMRLAIGTGARRGELLALRWSDVDFYKATLCIRASLSETRSGVVEKSTKTDRVRLVALASTALEALRRQRVLQAQDRFSAGAAYVDSGHVFQNQLGGTIRPNRASEVFRELAARAGTSTKRLHALRHTSVSWLIAAGVDVRTVAALAGHSSPTITLSVYSHIVAGAQAKAVTAIDDRLATVAEAGL